MADNGSTDASVTLLNRISFFPVERLFSIRIMALRMDIILALQQVDAEYVVLLNSDEVTEHWLNYNDCLS